MRKTKRARYFRFMISLAIPWMCLGNAWARDVTIEEEPNDRRGITYVYKLTITPAAEPVPAMRHRLTVEPHKTIPANAATNYLRSYGERSLEHPWNYIEEKFGRKTVHKWYSNETPIKDLPMDKVAEASQAFGGYVDNHIRRATICRYCDWGLAEEDLRGEEVYGFLLPSIQNTRTIARVLMLRARFAIAEKRYDDAIDHLRMTYQLSQNVGEMKFLVANLVAVAESGMANGVMLDLIAAPESPNMYWALAELPRPLLSARESLRLEMSAVLRAMPSFKDVETAQHSPEQWSLLLEDVVQDFLKISLYAGSSIKPSVVHHSQWISLGAGLAGYSEAKQRLIESGMAATEVEKMAVGQVMLIDAAREYQRFADEQEKAIYLPVQWADQTGKALERSLRESPFQMGAVLADMLLPAARQIRVALTRVERDRNALMVIEAIRMHAAETGTLPKTLDEIKLYVPPNPATGGAFVYRRNGETAILELPLSDGIPGDSRRYEIKLASKKN